MSGRSKISESRMGPAPIAGPTGHNETRFLKPWEPRRLLRFLNINSSASVLCLYADRCFNFITLYTYHLSYDMPWCKVYTSSCHGLLARWVKWRACDVGEAKEGLENELWCRWSDSSFSNPSVALSMSQLILEAFRCFTYVTAHSLTLFLLLLRHRLFSYVTWWAANALKQSKILSLLWK